MKIFDLPTDNLYKFVCFAGLSLIIISPIYYQVFTHQVILKNMDLKLEMALQKMNAKFTGQDVEELRKDTDALEGYVKENPKNLQKVIEAQKAAALVRQKLRDSEIAMVRMDRLAQEVFFFNKQHDLLKILSIIGSMLGFFLFVVGLYLWFTRIQVYEDKIIKQKALDQYKE
jgi:hypothetical protein